MPPARTAAGLAARASERAVEKRILIVLMLVMCPGVELRGRLLLTVSGVTTGIGGRRGKSKVERQTPEFYMTPAARNVIMDLPRLVFVKKIKVPESNQKKKGAA